MPVPTKSLYISCIKINGVAILPPLITKQKQKEIEQYRHAALRIEKAVKKQRELQEYINQLYETNQSKSHGNYYIVKENACTDICEIELVASSAQLTCDIEASQYVNDEFFNITGKYSKIQSTGYKPTIGSNITEENCTNLTNRQYLLQNNSSNCDHNINLQENSNSHEISSTCRLTEDNPTLHVGNSSIHELSEQHLQLPVGNSSFHKTQENSLQFYSNTFENNQTQQINTISKLKTCSSHPIEIVNCSNININQYPHSNIPEKIYTQKKSMKSYSTISPIATLDLTLNKSCNLNTTMQGISNSISPIKNAICAITDKFNSNYTTKPTESTNTNIESTLQENYTIKSKSLSPNIFGSNSQFNTISPNCLTRSNSYTLDVPNSNRLIRSNSYILDAPSPALIEHYRKNNELSNDTTLISERCGKFDTDHNITATSEDISSPSISRYSYILDEHSIKLIEQLKTNTPNKSVLNESYVIDTHSCGLMEQNKTQNSLKDMYVLDINDSTLIKTQVDENKSILTDNYIVDNKYISNKNMLSRDSYTQDKNSSVSIEHNMDSNKGDINQSTLKDRNNSSLMEHRKLIMDKTNKLKLRDNYVLDRNNSDLIKHTLIQHHLKQDKPKKITIPALLVQPTQFDDIPNKPLKNNYMLDTSSSPLINNQHSKCNSKGADIPNSTTLTDSIQNAIVKYNELELLDLDNTSKINESIYSNFSRMGDILDVDTSHTETELRNLSDNESTVNISDTESQLKEFINNNVPNSKTEDLEESIQSNFNDSLREMLQNIPEEYTKQIIELIERQQQLESGKFAISDDSHSRISFADPEIYSTPIEGDGTVFYSINDGSQSDFIMEKKHENEILDGIDAELNCNRELFPSSQLQQQRSKENYAASIIGAAVKGYLVRRLLHTDKVQNLIQVIKDALICAVQLHSDTLENINESDVELHRRLIQQVSAACYAFHSVFFATSIHEQMAIISTDRNMKIEKAKRPTSNTSLTGSFRSRKGSTSFKASTR